MGGLIFCINKIRFVKIGVGQVHCYGYQSFSSTILNLAICNNILLWMSCVADVSPAIQHQIKSVKRVLGFRY